MLVVPKPVSIYEFIKGHRYEISIFTTYSVTFSFYEEVLLPHLLANGCYRNLLIVDAGQCAASFADASSRPRRAGSDYYLLPVSRAMSFHPKIGLLLGRTAGVAFV